MSLVAILQLIAHTLGLNRDTRFDKINRIKKNMYTSDAPIHSCVAFVKDHVELLRGIVAREKVMPNWTQVI